MKSSQSKSDQPKINRVSSKLAVLTIVVVGGVLIIGWTVLAWFQGLTRNYAYDVAKPFESALVQAGVVKKCDRGDSGKGPDNREPWYGATFEVGKDVESTKALVGQSLMQAGLPSADFSLDQENKEWNLNVVKDSPYQFLKSGQAKISVRVYEQRHFDITKDKTFCTLSGERRTPGVTAFTIGIGLPEYK